MMMPACQRSKFVIDNIGQSLISLILMLRLLCRALDCVISGRGAGRTRLMIESRMMMGRHDSDDVALCSSGGGSRN